MVWCSAGRRRILPSALCQRTSPHFKAAIETMVELSYIAVAALCVLIATAVFVILQQHSTAVSFVPGLSGQGNKAPTFIICGPSNSGKTTFFHWLTAGKVIPTVMSQEPNSTTRFPLPSSTKGSSSATNFKLIEFPGHNKLHSLLMDEIKNSTNVHGLVFMVDSTSDPTKLVDAAHFLYKVLTVTERRPGGVDVLIACNKSDLFSARQPTKIKEILEQEINAYRGLQAANVSKVDTDGVNANGANDEEEVELGAHSEKFTFDQLDGNLDVIAGSVLKNKADKWECWIDERAVNF